MNALRFVQLHNRRASIQLLRLHIPLTPALPAPSPMKVDPTLTRADRLVGQVLGQVGALPDVYSELEINFFLLRRLLGVRSKEGEKQGKVGAVWGGGHGQGGGGARKAREEEQADGEQVAEERGRAAQRQVRAEGFVGLSSRRGVSSGGGGHCAWYGGWRKLGGGRADARESSVLGTCLRP